MSSDDPNQPLLESPKGLEVTCTSVHDDDVEITLFDKRKPKAFSTRIIRVCKLECKDPNTKESDHNTEESDPNTGESDPNTEESDSNTKPSVSCVERVKHPCGRQVLSPRLQTIRDKGTEVIRSFLLPILSRWSSELRILFMIVSILLGLVSLGLAISTGVKDPNNVLAPVRIAVTLCTIGLSSVHLVITGFQYRKGIESDPKINDASCVKVMTKNICSLSSFELYCILLKEAFEYPVVVCNIIENAAKNSYYTDKLHFVYFLFSVLKLIYEVYLIRALVLCSTIHSLRQLRQGSTFVEPTKSANRVTEMTLNEIKTEVFTTHGLMIEVFFCAHVLCQMLCQIIILAALWVKIQCENPNFIDVQELSVSSNSGLLIFSGFALPIVGTLAFFIPWNKHVQLYPIEFMIDMLCALRKSGITSIPQNARSNLQKIQESIISAVTEDSLSTKQVIYTILTTPVLTVLSFLFLFFYLTTLVGIIVGPTVEYENGTVTCDLSITNGTNVEGVSQYVVVWEGINYAALVVTTVSNCLVLGISIPSIFYIIIGIVLIPLVPPLFILSVFVYFVTKCVCPRREDCNICTCLCICFVALYRCCDDMFLRTFLG